MTRVANSPPIAEARGMTRSATASGQSGTKIVQDAGQADTFLLTGFLGSGKTTLLNRLLHDPTLADTLVLINEFGSIALDHHLIESVRGEMVVLSSGCLCCTIRGDLSRTLERLATERARGDLPRFSRVVIETTGLADPVPLLQVFLGDPVIQAHYVLAGIVTTVDALHAEQQFADQFEAIRQVAVADRIVLTKSDLAGADRIASVRRAISEINAGAPIVDAASATTAFVMARSPFDRAVRSEDVRHWLGLDSGNDHLGHDQAHQHTHHHHRHDGAQPDVNRHSDRIRAISIEIDGPVSISGIEEWASDLVFAHGQKLLRLKGIVMQHGAAYAVHGVQDTMHAPARMSKPPFDDGRSRIVVIVSDLDPAMVEASLRAAARAA